VVYANIVKMHKKIELTPGVNINVNQLEFKFLKYLKKVGVLPIDKLNSDGLCVINKLLSKGLLARSKRGNHVYIQLHRRIQLPKD
jgi:hypothetical protein